MRPTRSHSQATLGGHLRTPAVQQPPPLRWDDLELLRQGDMPVHVHKSDTLYCKEELLPNLLGQKAKDPRAHAVWALFDVCGFARPPDTPPHTLRCSPGLRPFFRDARTPRPQSAGASPILTSQSTRCSTAPRRRRPRATRTASTAASAGETSIPGCASCARPCTKWTCARNGSSVGWRRTATSAAAAFANQSDHRHILSNCPFIKNVIKMRWF